MKITLEHIYQAVKQEMDALRSLSELKEFKCPKKKNIDYGDPYMCVYGHITHHLNTTKEELATKISASYVCNIEGKIQPFTLDGNGLTVGERVWICIQNNDPLVMRYICGKTEEFPQATIKDAVLDLYSFLDVLKLTKKQRKIWRQFKKELDILRSHPHIQQMKMPTQRIVFSSYESCLFAHLGRSYGATGFLDFPYNHKKVKKFRKSLRGMHLYYNSGTRTKDLDALFLFELILSKVTCRKRSRQLFAYIIGKRKTLPYKGQLKSIISQTF